MDTEEQSAQGPGAGSRSYPCTACGAAVVFAPGSDAMHCPYCGHEQAVAAAGREVREHSFDELAALPVPERSAPAEGTHTYVCPGCGAHTESDALSLRCQFCDTALVADASAAERVRPEAVLPFGLDRDAAREALRAWTSSRWFAPSRLKKVGEAETFRGSYLPHWTYDAQTLTHYRGQRGDYYYVTETYTTTENGETVTKTREVRRTRWSPASGTVGRAFDDVLVAGTTHVGNEQLDKLTPWPLEEARPFQEEYLAGFQTVRYDIEPEDGLVTAKERMATVIRSDCRADIGGDEQRVSSTDTRYSALTFKLMLLPVWFLTYLYAGTSWQVMVNARTAEVIGERPYSKAKIAAAVLGVLALAALITFLVMRR
ncbi:hypothetical protein [Streptomyces sp. NPDC092952]|uniref:hypothetical protein n=1 Tax=Streptomyces sp. NPDC092952 TaxID=3366018 RepID=UPI003825D112